MVVTIEPSIAQGRMTAPPSKSMAHRMLICAALAEGTSVIRNVDCSQDILATIDCLRALGADITWEDGTVHVQGMRIAHVRDAQIMNAQEIVILPCRESGSTLRFLLPLCLMDGVPHVLTGSERLLQRPLAVYETICREQGIVFVKEKNRLQVAGTLAAGEYEIPGNVSSQFISGLLFALPLLEEDSRIHLAGTVESRPYIDMTMQALPMFGVRTEWTGTHTIEVPGRQAFLAQDVCVEGDYSSACFFDALHLLGGDVTVEGLAKESAQGDRIYRQYLDQVDAGYAELDLADCPDLAPILMVLAALKHGAKFTGTARLKFKESDRGAAMQEELEKAGVKVELADNEIRVAAGVKAPAEPLQGHGDHRIVMALAVLLSKVGGSIRGAEAVAKSLPDFWERLAGLGIRVRLENEAKGK